MESYNINSVVQGYNIFPPAEDSNRIPFAGDYDRVFQLRVTEGFRCGRISIGPLLRAITMGLCLWMVRILLLLYIHIYIYSVKKLTGWIHLS